MHFKKKSILIKILLITFYIKKNKRVNSFKVPKVEKSLYATPFTFQEGLPANKNLRYTVQ